MKKLILFLAVALMGCAEPNRPAETVNSVNPEPLRVEHLMGQVSGGLHLIQIDDTTRILIYRGVESSAMIQLK